MARLKVSDGKIKTSGKPRRIKTTKTEAEIELERQQRELWVLAELTEARMDSLDCSAQLWAYLAATGNTKEQWPKWDDWGDYEYGSCPLCDYAEDVEERLSSAGLWKKGDGNSYCAACPVWPFVDQYCMHTNPRINMFQFWTAAKSGDEKRKWAKVVSYDIHRALALAKEGIAITKYGPVNTMKGGEILSIAPYPSIHIYPTKDEASKENIVKLFESRTEGETGATQTKWFTVGDMNKVLAFIPTMDDMQNRLQSVEDTVSDMQGHFAAMSDELTNAQDGIGGAGVYLKDAAESMNKAAAEAQEAADA